MDAWNQLMKENKVTKPDELYAFMKKQDMQDYLKKNKIGFTMRLKKAELWHLILQHTKKSSAKIPVGASARTSTKKSQKSYWDTLKSRSKHEKRSKKEEKKTTRKGSKTKLKSCKDIIDKVVDLYSETLYTRAELEQTIKANLQTSQKEMTLYLAQQVQKELKAPQTEDNSRKTLLKQINRMYEEEEAKVSYPMTSEQKEIFINTVIHKSKTILKKYPRYNFVELVAQTLAKRFKKT